ncbi:trypsin-like peptidase domain-containing protein [Sphaerisporangium sp. TRM90804]|uniref:S1C family serine protease n=1 Tax=Sphaerisporangium sp. TRM90804 TaxID=3031113 RepID=UPI002446EDF2|nr:trypsin-like peptidase domain-containing protein [Sphaerisporangium sp. TRM90804]MDH2429860.1 trypsin-like peptidase domain-containing protein [Sphaerisporangium sp. TRM90804]
MSDETRTFDDGDVPSPSQRTWDDPAQAPGEGRPGASGEGRSRPQFRAPQASGGPDPYTGPGPFGPDLGGTAPFPREGGAYGRPAPGAYGREGAGAYGGEAAGQYGRDAGRYGDATGSYGRDATGPYGREGAGSYGGEPVSPYSREGAAAGSRGRDDTGLIPFDDDSTRHDFASEGHGDRPDDRSGPSGWGNPSGGPVPPSPGGPYGPPPPRNPYGMGPGWAPPPGAGHGEPGAPGPRGQRTGVLAVLAVVIALLASTAGSLGTYLLTRSDSSGVDPSYSLGTPTGAIVNRPPDSVAGVASKVLPSVVSLDVKGGSEAGTGSGFVIKGGYVVTNNHVVAAAAQTGAIKVLFDNKKSSNARIVGRDPSSDIAVVKPDNTFGAAEVLIGNSDRVVVGDPVIAIGSPLGLSGTVTTGIVSSLNRPVTAGGDSGAESSYINAIQTDAAINPGNSGGPLVNGAGEVIGVNSAIATLGSGAFGGQSGSIGLGFSIPINHVRRIAEELITTGTAKRSRIGVHLDENYEGDGVRIATSPQQGQEPVIAGGPADKAGLRAGDVIMEVNGNPVGQPSELIVSIRSRAPGDKVTIKYQRDGEEKTTVVTIDAGPVPTPQPS